MSWLPPPSLETLRLQLNKYFPQRSKISDGGIGDAKHAASKSDHNPTYKIGKQAYFRARDFTHDPKTGIDCNWLAERLREEKDPRLDYVIWNKRMFSSYPVTKAGRVIPAWTWRAYTGSKNMHTKHLHISCKPTDKAVLDKTPWDLFPVTATMPVAALIPQAFTDVARVTEEDIPVELAPTTPADMPLVPVEHCQGCRVAHDPENLRTSDKLCPDCVEDEALAKRDTPTGEAHNTKPPTVEVKETKLKGWYTAIGGFVLTNAGALISWHAGLPPIVQASMFVGGGIATAALIVSVIWLKDRREQRAANKENAMLEAKQK